MVRPRLFLLVLLLVLGLGTTAWAEGEPGTKGLTVTDNAQAVTVWTDRNEYTVGDPVSVSFRSAFDGTVAVYCDGPDGRSTALRLPEGSNGSVQAGRAYTLPAFTAGEPSGAWRLTLVLTKTKAPAPSSSVSILTLLLQGLAAQQQAPAEERVTAGYAFTVKPRTPMATVRITGAFGARIFIDGRDSGTAPLTTEVEAGRRHHLVAIMPGMLVQVRQVTETQSRTGLIEWSPSFRPIK